jgi:hypothetical protein
MQNFKVGDVVTGVVTSVKVYGAFLDIGGAMGLLHISQITHERLTTVEQVLQVRGFCGCPCYRNWSCKGIQVVVYCSDDAWLLGVYRHAGVGASSGASSGCIVC